MCIHRLLTRNGLGEISGSEYRQCRGTVPLSGCARSRTMESWPRANGWVSPVMTSAVQVGEIIHRAGGECKKKVPLLCVSRHAQFASIWSDLGEYGKAVNSYKTALVARHVGQATQRGMALCPPLPGRHTIPHSAKIVPPPYAAGHHFAREF
jgi:hypothetical protein